MDSQDHFKRRRFFSRLFQRYIEIDEYDFDKRVHAELLFRIREYERLGSDSFHHNGQLEKYYDALYKYEKGQKPII